MTYRELLDALAAIPPESKMLDANVTMYDPSCDEFAPIVSLDCADASQSVLDEGHLYLSLNSPR